MVDGHSHLSLPGGSHWIDRGADPTELLLDVAEANGELQYRSGVRWARDVGCAVAGRWTAGSGPSASAVRERWRGRRGGPYIRAAGTWIAGPGAPPGLTVEAADGDELLAAATAQLDDGADFIKLYLDGADPQTSPWTADEITRVVRAVHARGARVTAHSGRLDGARKGAAAGVDSIEHGFELDADARRRWPRAARPRLDHDRPC